MDFFTPPPYDVHSDGLLFNTMPVEYITIQQTYIYVSVIDFTIKFIYVITNAKSSISFISSCLV